MKTMFINSALSNSRLCDANLPMKKLDVAPHFAFKADRSLVGI
jgi:hypothetical protein